ncbi:hypothetical protein M422DRAFT_164426, partial [Sphaerobolus stellatus SS14]
PFNPERVEQILKEVTIGDDLSEEQLSRVIDMIKEYANTFALTLSEVLPVDFVMHKLHINPSVPLPTKVHQKPLTTKQKPWFYGKIDGMEAAGIVVRVRADEVKCLAPTTLALKVYDNGGLTIEQLRTRANEECAKAGYQ